jgi:hypothetical protein
MKGEHQSKTERITPALKGLRVSKPCTWVNRLALHAPRSSRGTSRQPGAEGGSYNEATCFSVRPAPAEAEAGPRTGHPTHRPTRPCRSRGGTSSGPSDPPSDPPLPKQRWEIGRARVRPGERQPPSRPKQGWQWGSGSERGDKHGDQAAIAHSAPTALGWPGFRGNRAGLGQPSPGSWPSPARPPRRACRVRLQHLLQGRCPSLAGRSRRGNPEKVATPISRSKATDHPTPGGAGERKRWLR